MDRQEVIDALELVKNVYFGGGDVEGVINELIVYFQGGYKGFNSLSEICNFLRMITPQELEGREDGNS